MPRLFFALLALAGLCLFTAQPRAENAAAKPLAYVVKTAGVIGPATYDLVKRQLQHAAGRKADIVVLEMHTPGGLYNTTQDIIQLILDSPVPVATYVSPGGAHAASAGTYILYASHIAAMAPGTNIGAATPVRMGDDAPRDSDKDPSMLQKEKKGGFATPMDQKMVNDASAYLRSLAELRGRNLEWAEKAVREAESLTASEALSRKVIDVIADDIPALLDKIDGRTVKMAQGKTAVLKTKGAATETVVPDWRHKILDIITHPNVALLLMTLGFYGLVYEFANPGALVPGALGAIFILLGLFALNIMPINYAGLALIILGLAFMAAEAMSPTFGILGIAGAVAFIFGATMLIDTDLPGYGVDPWLTATLALTSLGLLSVVLGFTVKAVRRPATTGREELAAATGTVTAWAQGRGEVLVTGEIWKASAPADIILQKGDRVDILDIDGLTLRVAPHKTAPEKGEG